MKRLTKLFSLSLVLTLLVSLLALPAYADSDVVSAPTGGVYYVDDAGCTVSTQTKEYINRQNIALTNACGGQVAVVTLDFLNDLDTEQYAYEVFNQWGVGDKDKNNGTVFVLVTAEKKCWGCLRQRHRRRFFPLARWNPFWKKTAMTLWTPEIMHARCI